MSGPEGVPSPFDEIEHPKKRAYLAALVQTGGNVTRACEVAEISRGTPYSEPWTGDEAFQKALVLARAMAADHLEAEAIRRAYEGVEEPVGFHKGRPGAYVRKYSDTLMIFLLNGAKPDRYVRRVEHSGRIESGVLAVPVVTDDWDRIAKRMQGAAPNGDGPTPNGNGAG